MKKTLHNPPLVYVTICCKFSDISDFESYFENNIDKLHTLFIGLGFQEKIISNNVEFSFNINNADDIKTNKKLNDRYLFRATDNKSIVEISSNTLILKTTDYTDFEKFFDVFSNLLYIIVENIPNFKSVLLKNVGLRYVDVIVPDSEKKIDDYVENSILPIKLRDKTDYLRSGATTSIIKTGESQSLVATFEEVLVDANTKSLTKILPFDLAEYDPNCGLLINGKDSWLNLSITSYGILDINHYKVFEDNQDIDISELKLVIKGLHNDIGDVFWNIISESAEREWGVINE